MSSPLTKSLFALSTDVDQEATRGEDPLARHSNLLSVPFSNWTVPLVISERLTVTCATGGSIPGENIPLCVHTPEAVTWDSYKMATVSSNMILLQLGVVGVPQSKLYFLRCYQELSPLFVFLQYSSFIQSMLCIHRA